MRLRHLTDPFGTEYLPIARFLPEQNNKDKIPRSVLQVGFEPTIPRLLKHQQLPHTKYM